MTSAQHRGSHEHRSVSDWIHLFERLDEEATSLTACPAAREAWSHSLSAWADHVVSCPTCRGIAREQEVYGGDLLDCPTCRGALEVVYDLVDEAEHYEPSVVWELQRAERFLEQLTALPVPEQVTRVRAEPTYQQWGFAQRLLFNARSTWHRNPELALDRSLVAVAVAEKLDPASYGAEWIADLEAKAHSYLGNSHRILGQFAQAEEEFILAEACLRRGVRSGRADAGVFMLKASFLKDQNRHGEALAVLDRLERFYDEHNDHHTVGRIALKRADVYDLLAEPDQAAQECARAASLLNPQREPLLPLVARKNAINYLVSAGDIKRARALFDALPPMPEPLIELQRHWLEGNLLRAEGRFQEARAVYERVRVSSAEASLFYDAALASLDLALTAFQHSGRSSEVRAMAEEATVQLTLAGAKREAFAALRLLLQAVRQDALSLAVLERTRARLVALQPSS